MVRPRSLWIDLVGWEGVLVVLGVNRPTLVLSMDTQALEGNENVGLLERCMQFEIILNYVQTPFPPTPLSAPYAYSVHINIFECSLSITVPWSKSRHWLTLGLRVA